MASSWTDLPPEIRLRILEFVILPQRDEYELAETPLYHGIGRYAVVNREWQNFIESINFRRIMVDDYRLSEFDRFFRGSPWRSARRKYVSVISLEISLPERDELDKWTPEERIREMQDRNSAALTMALTKLFVLLSSWRLEETRSAATEMGTGTGTGDTDPFGLTLEIVLVGDEDAGLPHPDRLDSEHQDTRLQLDPKFLVKDMQRLLEQIQQCQQLQSIHHLQQLHPMMNKTLSEAAVRLISSGMFASDWTSAPHAAAQKSKAKHDHRQGPPPGGAGGAGGALPAVSGGNIIMPKLNFVRRLCIPTFAVPSLPARTISVIISHLDGLKYLNIERLGDQSDIVARNVDLDLSSSLARLPPSIERISLFEEPGLWMPRFNGEPDFDGDGDDMEDGAGAGAGAGAGNGAGNGNGNGNGHVHAHVHGNHIDGIADYEKQPRVTTTHLVRQVVDTSQNLKQFAASFWIDAIDFFHDFVDIDDGQREAKSASNKPTSLLRLAKTKRSPHSRKLPSWPELQTLTLTSHYFSKKRKARDVNKLLTAAARAARRMPKLRVLEMYNVHGGVVDGIFRYRATEQSTTIGWESSWAFKPSDKVYGAWSDVAKEHTRHGLQGILGKEVPAPGQRSYDPIWDWIPLRGLGTRSLALYEMSAREYYHEWIDAHELANGEEPPGEDDGWETEDTSDG